MTPKDEGRGQDGEEEQGRFHRPAAFRRSRSLKKLHEGHLVGRVGPEGNGVDAGSLEDGEWSGNGRGWRRAHAARNEGSARSKTRVRPVSASRSRTRPLAGIAGLARVGDRQRDDVVPPMQRPKGLLVAGSEEIGEDEDDRALLEERRSALQREGKVGGRVPRGSR